MKIISKKVSVDAESFTPMLELVLQIPLEPMQDSSAFINEDELHIKYGKMLLDGIKEYNNGL